MYSRKKMVGIVLIVAGMTILLLGPSGLVGKALAGGDDTPTCNGYPYDPDTCCCPEEGEPICEMNE